MLNEVAIRLQKSQKGKAIWLKTVKTAIAFLLSLVLFIGLGVYFQSRDAIYLAVAGPTGGDNVSGIEMVQGAQLYVDSVNASGGVDGQGKSILKNERY
ncbi:MAG: hypothetical protein Tsb0014_00010 [Pleurocapsa sp.]